MTTPRVPLDAYIVGTIEWRFLVIGFALLGPARPIAPLWLEAAVPLSHVCCLSLVSTIKDNHDTSERQLRLPWPMRKNETWLGKPLPLKSDTFSHREVRQAV